MMQIGMVKCTGGNGRMPVHRIGRQFVTNNINGRNNKNDAETRWRQTPRASFTDVTKIIMDILKLKKLRNAWYLEVVVTTLVGFTIDFITTSVII